jgi:hypothetical protein
MYIERAPPRILSKGGHEVMKRAPRWLDLGITRAGDREEEEERAMAYERKY